MMDRRLLHYRLHHLVRGDRPVRHRAHLCGLTQDMDARTRRRERPIAPALTASGILIAFAAFGEAVLGFRRHLDGGVQGRRRRAAVPDRAGHAVRTPHQTARRPGRGRGTPDPSVFPLAIPLVAGPGSIATIILLAGQHPGIQGIACGLAVMLAVMAVVLLFFLSGGLIAPHSGQDRAERV